MSKRLLLVAAFLCLTIGLRAWVSVIPTPVQRESLSQFPNQVGEWKMTSSSTLDEDVAGVLKADDYLLRRYSDENGHSIDFFIAYYQTQRAGESMHSPKNCLPGSGWIPIINDTAVLRSDAQGKQVLVNRYVIEKDSDRALAIYWYQASGRIIANEYLGKLYLVWDSLRTGRRDGGIVRVFIPLARGQNSDRASQTALDFARAVTPELARFLPN